MDSWSAQIQTWNKMIRDGSGNDVAEALDSIPRKGLKPAHLAQIGNLAWRVGRPSRGAFLLSAAFRRQRQLNNPDCPELICEYAQCLTDLGAIPESRLYLQSVSKSIAKAKFYLASTFIKEWNYQDAIPLLEDYLQNLTDPYQRTVVNVNLASALVSVGQAGDAERIIRPQINRLKKEGHKLLTGNALEILGQVRFYQGEYQDALRLLTESEELLKDSQNAGWLFCKKWQFIVNLALRKAQGKLDSAALVDEMGLLRRLCVQRQSWESIRELDFFTGLFTDNEEQIARVYYGTPFLHYRLRMVRHLPPGWSPPEDFVRSSEEGRIVQLSELMGPQEAALTPLMKNLIMTLLSDYYSPFRPGSLFGKVFPDEHYNVEGSPHRIFRTVLSCRQALEQKGIVSRIENTKYGYRFRIDKNEGWIIPRFLIESQSWDGVALAQLYLRQVFGQNSFSSAQFAKTFHVSQRSANRMIKSIGQEGTLQEIGQGRAKRFRLAS
ncbi:MAG: tetratricopeptide repeat protein [Bdellovibrionales bacterium]